jgi:hypothetical protein
MKQRKGAEESLSTWETSNRENVMSIAQMQQQTLR